MLHLTTQWHVSLNNTVTCYTYLPHSVTPTRRHSYYLIAYFNPSRPGGTEFRLYILDKNRFPRPLHNMKSYEREREEWNEGSEKKKSECQRNEDSEEEKWNVSEKWRFSEKGKGEGKRWGKVREEGEDRGDLMKYSNVIVRVWAKLININNKYEKWMQPSNLWLHKI